MFLELTATQSYGYIVVNERPKRVVFRRGLTFQLFCIGIVKLKIGERNTGTFNIL